MTYDLLTRQSPLPSTIIDKPKRRIQISFSSETKVTRQHPLTDPWLEMLGHNAEEVDLSKLNAGARGG